MAMSQEADLQHVNPRQTHSSPEEKSAATTASLTNRVRSGVGWTAASSLVMHALTLVRSIVLARLLAQDDFGLFGMALTVIGALTVLTDIGLESSIIANKFESKEEMTEQLNTVWTTELLRRLGITLLMLAAVYPTAHFYGDERLLSILPILSLVPVLQGFGNIGLSVLRRQVNFVQVVWFDLSCALLQTVVPIGFALVTRSVWALVWGQVITVALTDLASYAFYPHRPRFTFNKEAFKKAFKFGKYMFIIGVMSYITTTADNIIIGRLLGAEVLGSYIVAYALSSLPYMVFSRVFGGILFPAYAELSREGGNRLSRAVVRIFLIATAALVLIVAPLALLSDEIVLLLYGQKWKTAGPILQILMILGFMRGLLQLLGPLFLGLNRPDLEARSRVIEGVFFLIVLFPFTQSFGAVGAAWAGVLVFSLSCLLRFFFARHLVPEAFSRVPMIIFTAILAGLGGMAAGEAALSLAATPLTRRLLGGSVCLMVTLLLLLLFKPHLREEIATALGATRWHRAGKWFMATGRP